MRRVRAAAALCCGLLLSGGGTVSTAEATTAGRAVGAHGNACPSGLVAITFDDGPSSVLTPDFVDLLHDRHVPATFFVVGRRVREEPGAVRHASALGFTIGNQTYGHENLVELSGAEIRTTLRRTRRAIRAARARPSTLMRPPFGSIDDRVRGVVRDLGLVPVLWTDDPRDWDARSPAAIVASTLAQLHPGEPNIVLLHDGVANSANTLLALPRIIRGVRSRGYCFARLDARGRPTPAVPRVRVADASVAERPGGSLMSVAVTLGRPTSRETSVRVVTGTGSATPGLDYVGLDQRLVFPAGATRRVVAVKVRDDQRDEPTERFAVHLSDARGQRIGDGVAAGVIRDDDPPPRVRVGDAQVAEPDSGTVDVPVTLRLNRASGKRVRVTVSTEAGSADATDFVPRTQRLSFAPGAVEARFTVTVLADTLEEGPETFEVRSHDPANVVVADGTGLVTILPPSD